MLAAVPAPVLHKPAVPPPQLGVCATLRAALPSVDVRKVTGAILGLKKTLATKHGIVPSDRRWLKAKKLIQAHALLNGRLIAAAADVLVIADSLWERPEDRAVIYGAIASAVSPDLAYALRFHDAAVESVESIDFDSDAPQAVQALAGANQTLKGIHQKMEALDQSGGVETLTAKVGEMRAKVGRAAMSRLGF